MGSVFDLLASFLGLLIVGYGLFCLLSGRVWAGIRGYELRTVYGGMAKGISIAYIIGGSILIVGGFLSWILGMAREDFLVIGVIGGGIPFIGNLVGFLWGEL